MLVRQPHKKYEGGFAQMDNNSLAHTTWECKYHIVFAPKYRRKIIYKKIRADVGRILSELCKRKGVEIIEAEACPDHVHMFVRIPPKYSVSEVMGYLKGKSSLMIFERHANLKYKYGNRHFWCRGYYVDTVGKNALFCAKVLDLKAYRQLIANNSNITNLDINDLASMNMFQYTTIDINDVKDIHFPVIPLYYYRLNNQYVLVHERNLKRALNKEERRRMESVMNLPNFSWTDEKFLLKILEVIQ